MATLRKKTAEYNAWGSMIQRCTNRNRPDWKNYGGRGISVCNRWLNFANFLMDMGEKPEGFTLNRIDNDGDYEPGNCNWATYFEQHRNRRNNRFITFQGRTQTLSEWARELGINQGTIDARINRFGWSDEEALITPVRRQK